MASPQDVRPEPGSAVLFLRKFNNMYMSGSWCGEVKGPFTVRQIINFHKLLVIPIYLAQLRYFAGDWSLKQEWGPAAGVLLVCHGTYGYLWVHKDIYFPDPSWQMPASCTAAVGVFLYPLALYYLPMFCLITHYCDFARFGQGNEVWIIMAGLWFYIIGMFYHFGADLQKHVQLSIERPRRLITTGLFAHIRNPNYFGEIMIYTGYVLFSMNWLPLVAFVSVWLQIFVPNMLAKEASMSRHAAWKDWVARTGFVYPHVPIMIKEFFCNALSRRPSITYAGEADDKDRYTSLP